jgi:hypothetical protein
MDQLMAYLTNPLFLVLIAFIVLLLAFNTVQKLGRGRAWKQIAAETGLQFSQHRTGTYTDQQLGGVYRKRSLTLTERESQEYRADRHRDSQEGNRADTDTEIRLAIDAPQSVKMKIVRVIVLGEAARVTGDTELDRRFDISSVPTGLAQKALAPSAIRSQLSRLKVGSTIRVEDSKLIFNQAGRISDGRYLRFLFEFLSGLADGVETAAGKTS